jgi:tetratricopeptide (TPR) repeat protein
VARAAPSTFEQPAKKSPTAAQKAPPDSKEFEDLAKRATAEREADHPQQAIELYRQALKLNPKWGEGWFYLGTLFYDADHYADALPVFRNAVELTPAFGSAWVMLGLCEFETGDLKNSLLHLQKGRTLGLGANDELINVTRYHEALLLNTVGEFEAASELLTSLLARGVGSIDVKMALGLATLRVSLLPDQLDPSKDALVHAVGEVATEAALNNLDQALAGYRQLLQDFPRTPFLHYAYGITLLSLSRFDEAEKEFKEEMKVTPDSALPYMYLGYIELQTKQYQEALPTCEAAVRLAPHAFPGHYLLGRAYLELRDISKAIEELETARRLAPYSPEVRYNLARAYARAKRNDDAARERKEFARLSAIYARQAGVATGTSYRSSSDRGVLGPRELSSPPPPLPK